MVLLSEDDPHRGRTFITDSHFIRKTYTHSMSKLIPNITVPIGLRQLKEEYDDIKAIEKEFNDRISARRAQFYAKIQLKIKIDKIKQVDIKKALGVGNSIITEWKRKGARS